MAARFTVHARATRQAALIVLAVAAGTASAAPKGADAKAAFSKGLAAYQRKDYTAAALAFAKSDYLEPDLETEYAWAQAERKAGNCNKAVQLYEKLLGNPTLPAANRTAVQQQLEECKAIIAAEKPEKSPEKPPEKPPAPAVADKSDPPATPETPERPAPATTLRAWWKEPVGGSLVTLGVLSGAVGGYFLYTGHTAEQQSSKADNFAKFTELRDKAVQRGAIGVIATATGGALLVGGVLWYALHSGGGEKRTRVTGWLAPSGAGIAGRF
jgi:tetratricopeptide (TPR) repeat protein